MVDDVRRVILLAGACGLLGIAGAAAQYGGPHGHGEQRRKRHRRRDDHDCARRALQEGRARPLAEILPTVESALGGEVIEIELEHCDDRIVYEVKVLRPDGRLVEAKVDARTGEVLEEEM
ncbi:PepSY domain-containing protein [Blastochloris sulfoviridis]|uniref:Peptidase M4 n=1 Tax=Blastochloris sulfoviridis TaxID=50712 RepID=A0A5M6I0H9_9HYPH|nr:PepSY domain-containing protein [Blastochloris sulfoviridis]KAA5601682.1 peptidase M4 [Blastochloris sulfoviridis]